MTPSAGTLPSGAVESNFVQVPYILGGAVVGYNLGSNLTNIRSSRPTRSPRSSTARSPQWSNLAIINTNGGLSSTTGKALQALYTE